MQPEFSIYRTQVCRLDQLAMRHPEDRAFGRAAKGLAKRSVDFANIGSGTSKKHNRNGPPTFIGGLWHIAAFAATHHFGR
jgi:hypothetical protein